MIKIAEPEIVEDRLNTCKSCSEIRQVFNLDYCGICKCALITKTRILQSNCPLDKWRKT